MILIIVNVIEKWIIVSVKETMINVIEIWNIAKEKEEIHITIAIEIIVQVEKTERSILEVEARTIGEDHHLVTISTKILLLMQNKKIRSSKSRHKRNKEEIIMKT